MSRARSSSGVVSRPAQRRTALHSPFARPWVVTGREVTIFLHRSCRPVTTLVFGAGVDRPVVVVVPEVPWFAGLDPVVASGARDDALLDMCGPLFPDRLVFGAVSGG